MVTAANLTLANLSEGQLFSFNVQVTEKMVDNFAKLTGDESPLHIDDNFAKEHGFPRRIAHGALISGFISRLIGMHCPGRLAILHSLNMKYHRPTHPGDELIIAGTIEQISESTGTITLQLAVTNKATGAVNAKGKAQVGFLTLT